MPGDTPRVRFAPSPTGYFHVGSARAALFNWLVARQSGGTFVLRIEDTDEERGREEWVDGIISAMHWLSMDPDEGPYRQSQRTDRYHQAVDALWDGGFLYACDCTRDEIDARNRAAGIQTPGYDGFCRERGLARGDGRALRFRTPDDGVTVVRRRHPRPGRVPLRHHGRLRGREGQWGAAVRPGQRGGRHRHGHHPRHPGRGPPAHHPEGRPGVGGLPVTRLADRRVDRGRRGGHPRPARLRPPAPAGQRAAQEAVQAPGPGGRRVLPGPGLPARGVRQLPRPAGLEPPGRGGALRHRPDDRSGSASRTSTTRRPSSTWSSSPT